MKILIQLPGYDFGDNCEEYHFCECEFDTLTRLGPTTLYAHTYKANNGHVIITRRPDDSKSIEKTLLSTGIYSSKYTQTFATILSKTTFDHRLHERGYIDRESIHKYLFNNSFAVFDELSCPRKE